MSEEKENTWNLTELTDSIVKSVKFAYTLRRKNKKKDIPYDGPIMECNKLLVCEPNIDEAFKVPSLEYKEERDKDAMWVIIFQTLRLGIEQGWRWMVDDMKKLQNRFKDIETALEHFQQKSSNPTDLMIIKDALDAIKDIKELTVDPGNMNT